MDQNILVSSGHALVSLLKAADATPRVVMWVSSPDTDRWRLWIMPPQKLSGPQHQYAMYRKLSAVISKNRSKLEGIDVGDIDIVDENHPALKGMRGAAKVTTGGTIRFKDTIFNGFFLPEAIVLQMDY